MVIREIRNGCLRTKRLYTNRNGCLRTKRLYTNRSGCLHTKRLYTNRSGSTSTETAVCDRLLREVQSAPPGTAG